MTYWGNDYDKQKNGLTKFDFWNAQEGTDAYNQRCNALERSRLLSLDGFRELLNVMGPRSVIQDTIDESNSRIKQLEADIATQNKTNEKLMAKIEDVEYSARE